MTDTLQQIAALYNQLEGKYMCDTARATAQMLIDAGYLTIELDHYTNKDGDVTTFRVYTLTTKEADN